jgi:hypothetical protein
VRLRASRIGGPILHRRLREAVAARIFELGLVGVRLAELDSAVCSLKRTDTLSVPTFLPQVYV